MQLAKRTDDFLNMRHHLPLLLPMDVFVGAHAHLHAAPELGGSLLERMPVVLTATEDGKYGRLMIEVRLKQHDELYAVISSKGAMGPDGYRNFVAVGSDRLISEPICQALRSMLECLYSGHRAAVPRSQEVCHLAFELLHARNPQIKIYAPERSKGMDPWRTFIQNLAPAHWNEAIHAPRSFVMPNRTRGLTLPVTLHDRYASCILVQNSPGGSFLTYAAPPGYLIRPSDAVHHSGHVSDLMAVLANVA